MFVIFIICSVAFEIVENNALLSNPELLSSYPQRNEYAHLRTSEIDLNKNCPGFKCLLSGLSQVQIDNLISKENDIRDWHANGRNVANMYSVHWNEHLAAYAQLRNQLSCILPPTGNTVIYEQVTNNWFPQNHTLSGEWPLNHSLPDYPTAVEVVLSSRAISINEYKKLQHSIEEYIEIFNKIDNISNPLDRRGGTVDMGCSYIVAGNATHDIDYMVCLYGFLYFDPNTTQNKYTKEIGMPCSGCTFYSIFNEIPETLGQKWSCGSRYPHTCSNLSKRSASGMIAPNEFNCSGKKLVSKLKKPISPISYKLEEIITRRPMPTKISMSKANTPRKAYVNGFFLPSVAVIIFKI